MAAHSPVAIDPNDRKAAFEAFLSDYPAWADTHHLDELRGLSGEELVAQRYQRFRALGTWQ